MPCLYSSERGYGLSCAEVDDHRVLNGIFWVLRSRVPWRDLPELYGPRTTWYNRFVRWTIRVSAGQDLVLRLPEREHIDLRSIVRTYLANGEAKAAPASGAIDTWSP